MTGRYESAVPYDGTAPADPTAVMARRSAAWVLDLLLFLGLASGLYAAQAEYVEIPPGLDRDACDVLETTDDDAASGCVVVGDRAYLLSSSEVGVQTLVSVGYLAVFVVLQGVTGGSPGKLVAGVRVVDAHGRNAGVAKSLGRTALWAVDGAPWFVPLVGPIVGLTATAHQRVGDMAAGTYVVATSAVGRPVRHAAPTPPPAGQSPWAAPPAGWPDHPPAAPSGATPPPPQPGAPAAPGDSTGPGPSTAPAPFVPPGAEPVPPEVTDAAPRDDADGDGTGHRPRQYELPPPQWDRARNTWLQWDPDLGAWLQWDTRTGHWNRIDT